MEYKELIIRCGKTEITFSDLDSDHDIEMTIINDHDGVETYAYLNMDAITKLRDHLIYLITKTNQS